MTQKYELVPVIFSSRRAGAYNARLAMAQAINADEVVVIKDVASYLKIIEKFRAAAHLASEHKDQILPIPVIINYSSSRLKTRAALHFADAVPHAFSVSLAEPVWPSAPFDIVARFPSSQSDRKKDRAYIEVATIPNLVNTNTLAKAREVWGPVIDPLRREEKLVAIFFGGDSRDYFFANRLRPQYALFAFKSILAALRGTKCDFVLSTSARTSDETSDFLKRHIAPLCIHSYFVSDQKKGDRKSNPVDGYRALADAIVVTPDSSSMLSEAIDANRPVFATNDLEFDLKYNLSGAPARFHETLVSRGRIYELEVESKRIELGIDGKPTRTKIALPIIFGTGNPVNSELQIAEAVRAGARQKWPSWQLV
jgi:mitochondrial fission protein ELM1